MRLLSVAVLGTALVAAGFAAPVTGLATAGAKTVEDEGIAVRPGVARPGQRVEVAVPGCPDGRVGSPVFVLPVTLRHGGGVAAVRRTAEAGTHPITATCGGRKVVGEFRVSGGFAWQSILSDAE